MGLAAGVGKGGFGGVAEQASEARRDGLAVDAHDDIVLAEAGGVGLAAIEIGKIMGARVIACASSQEKLAFARAHGADETVNYSNTSLRDALKTLTDGKGVDVVFDPVGGEFAEPVFRSIAWRGRYLVIGFTGGAIPALPTRERVRGFLLEQGEREAGLLGDARIRQGDYMAALESLNRSVSLTQPGDE